MARYVATISFTQQGLTNIQDTCRRAASFKSAAKKLGVKVSDIYWTLGEVDGFLVFDAPDEETATAAMIHLNTLGNVSTSTTRAYTPAEMEQVLSKLS